MARAVWTSAACGAGVQNRNCDRRSQDRNLAEREALAYADGGL